MFFQISNQIRYLKFVIKMKAEQFKLPRILASPCRTVLLSLIAMACLRLCSGTPQLLVALLGDTIEHDPDAGY